MDCVAELLGDAVADSLAQASCRERTAQVDSSLNLPSKFVPLV
jgi:hypothetical protein